MCFLIDGEEVSRVVVVIWLMCCIVMVGLL